VPRLTAWPFSFQEYLELVLNSIDYYNKFGVNLHRRGYRMRISLLHGNWQGEHIEAESTVRLPNIYIFSNYRLRFLKEILAIQIVTLRQRTHAPYISKWGVFSVIKWQAKIHSAMTQSATQHRSSSIEYHLYIIPFARHRVYNSHRSTYLASLSSYYSFQNDHCVWYCGGLFNLVRGRLISRPVCSCWPVN
jgi:hypothetical protein